MISNDRFKHSIAVARLLKAKCEDCQFGKDFAQEMFMLGLLHDIGYEFGPNSNHNILGGTILEKEGYKYFEEVKHHGRADSSYSSKALDLLNWADMHISGNGQYVSFDERLKDIKNRYGAESSQFDNAKKLIEQLKKKNFE